jgi:hypothetical protein
MTKHQFKSTSFKDKRVISSYSYAVGQPMGLYSSWPAMALTNHVMVRLAANRLGYKRFDRYLIIGDDIVIFNKDVALQYISILTTLGIMFNTDDSIWSDSIAKPYEIAKRLYRFGKEVSALPVNLHKNSLSLFKFVHLERSIRLDCKHSGESPKHLASALLMDYYVHKETWVDNMNYNSRTSIDMPLWAVWNDSTRNFTLDKTRLDFTDYKQLDWLILVMYLNEASKDTIQEYSNMLSGDNPSHREIIRVLLGDRYSGSSYSKRKAIKLARENSKWIDAIISDSVRARLTHSYGGSEREQSGLSDPFKFLRFYRGYNHHMESKFQNVVISSKNLVNRNPWRQIELDMILKWEKQLVALTDHETSILTEYLLSQREKIQVTRTAE